MKSIAPIALLMSSALMVTGCASGDAEDPGGFDGPAVYVDGAKGNPTAGGSLGSPVDTIAAAIKLAKAGDTIVVAAGTYAESADLPLDVGMLGAGSGKTILAPPAGEHGISLAAGGGKVRVEGVSISQATGYGLSAEVGEMTLADVKVEKTKLVPGSPGTGHGVQFVNGAKLIMENCNIIGNSGTGVLAIKVASVDIVDPAFSVSPRGDGGGQAIVDPAFSPASSISGNFGGGIAIVDPAFSPSGKTDEVAEHFLIRSTLIKDNFMFGLAVYGGSGTLEKTAISGGKKRNSEDFADGLVLSDGKNANLKSTLAVGTDTIIGSNERTGLLLSTPAVVNVSGDISANAYGGIWARGAAALVKLSAESRLSENAMVGVAVTFGARLEADGARIDKTKMRPFANPKGGKAVDIGDAIGVFDLSSASITGATLEGNARAGVVAHASGANAAGQVDIAVTGTQFIGGDYGIVVNKQLAGAAPASVPAAQLEKDNTFDGQKTKIDPAGELSVQVSPCGVDMPAETKCIPAPAGSD